MTLTTNERGTVIPPSGHWIHLPAAQGAMLCLKRLPSSFVSIHLMKVELIYSSSSKEMVVVTVDPLHKRDDMPGRITTTVTRSNANKGQGGKGQVSLV